MGKTRDLLKKIRDTKGTFHAKEGTIKDRNGIEVTMSVEHHAMALESGACVLRVRPVCSASRIPHSNCKDPQPTLLTAQGCQKQEACW